MSDYNDASEEAKRPSKEQIQRIRQLTTRMQQDLRLNNRRTNRQIRRDATNDFGRLLESTPTIDDVRRSKLLAEYRQKTNEARLTAKAGLIDLKDEHYSTLVADLKRILDQIGHLKELDGQSENEEAFQLTNNMTNKARKARMAKQKLLREHGPAVTENNRDDITLATSDTSDAEKDQMDFLLGKEDSVTLTGLEYGTAKLQIAPTKKDFEHAKPGLVNKKQVATQEAGGSKQGSNISQPSMNWGITVDEELFLSLTDFSNFYTWPKEMFQNLSQNDLLAFIHIYANDSKPSSSASRQEVYKIFEEKVYNEYYWAAWTREALLYCINENFRKYLRPEDVKRIEMAADDHRFLLCLAPRFKAKDETSKKIVAESRAIAALYKQEEENRQILQATSATSTPAQSQRKKKGKGVAYQTGSISKRGTAAVPNEHPRMDVFSGVGGAERKKNILSTISAFENCLELLLDSLNDF